MSPFFDFVTTTYQLELAHAKIQLIGGSAERDVHTKLSVGLSRDYTILRNVLIPTVYGKFTQIDHIVISRFGVSCIETKGHTGHVYGSSRSGIFSSYSHDKQIDFQLNPVRQNQQHVKYLQRLLASCGCREVKNLVVFPQAKSVKVYGYDEEVCPYRDLIERISQLKKPMYNDEQVASMIKMIQTTDLSHDTTSVTAHRQLVRSLSQA